jgi:hypothetical protein
LTAVWIGAFRKTVRSAREALRALERFSPEMTDGRDRLAGVAWAAGNYFEFISPF